MTFCSHMITKIRSCKNKISSGKYCYLHEKLHEKPPKRVIVRGNGDWNYLPIEMKEHIQSFLTVEHIGEVDKDMYEIYKRDLWKL